MASGNRKAIVAAPFAHHGLRAARFGGWMVTAASSMLVDGAHSVADSGHETLRLRGVAAATRAAAT